MNMNKYSRTWYFEVYTYFGRVLGRFELMEDELYHPALERARKFGQELDKNGVKHWTRLIT